MKVGINLCVMFLGKSFHLQTQGHNLLLDSESTEFVQLWDYLY